MRDFDEVRHDRTQHCGTGDPTVAEHRRGESRRPHSRVGYPGQDPEDVARVALGALEQAARDAAEGEEPVVVLAEVDQGRKARRVVLLDFEVWLAKVAKEPAVREEDGG